MLSEMTRLRREGRCPFCKKPINISEYRDKESWEEAKISGLCQKCQDNFFKEE